MVSKDRKCGPKRPSGKDVNERFDRSNPVIVASCEQRDYS
jgi:hypothetical protein